MIPPNAADHQRRNLRVEAAGKREVVNIVKEALAAFGPGPRNDLRLPRRPRKIDGLRNIGIPAPANHKEGGPPFEQTSERQEEIRRQDNVTVHVAEKIVAGKLLSPGKNEVELLRATVAAQHFRLVPQRQLPANLRRALVIPEEDHFRVWMEQLPAL